MAAKVSANDILAESSEKLEPLPTVGELEKLTEQVERKWLEEVTEKAERGEN